MIHTLYIKVTENCNLACPFCYVKQERNIIDEAHIARCMDELKPRNIVFHGGEPLLYPEIIISTIEKYPNVQRSITSNLSMPLTDDRLTAISLCDMATSYSVDRFDENQFKTFCENVRAVKALSRVTLLVTLSKEQLKQSQVDLIDAINKINPDNVTFERLYLPGADKALYEQTDDYLLKLFELMDIEKNNLLHQMKQAIERNTPVFSKGCDIMVRTLNPDGSICSCPNLYQHLSSAFRKRRECLLCDLYAYCEGDCLSYQNVCSFPKKTFRKMLGG